MSKEIVRCDLCARSSSGARRRGAELSGKGMALL